MFSQIQTHSFSLWAIFESLHQAQETLCSAEFCASLSLRTQVSLTDLLKGACGGRRIMLQLQLEDLGSHWTSEDPFNWGINLDR